MKFSHSIQFNAVPDWSSHYIAYSNLKKLIYHLEKSVHLPGPSDVETRPLLNTEDPEAVFSRALDVELEKISSFYAVKEKEVFDEVEDLLRDCENVASDEDGDAGPVSRPAVHHTTSEQVMHSRGPRSSQSRTSVRSTTDDGIEDSDEDDDDADETAALTKKRRSTSGSGGAMARRRTVPNIMHHSTDLTASMTEQSKARRYSTTFDDYADAQLYSDGIMLKKRIISLYVQLCELKSYIQLNKTGFSKVLKKFDKIVDRELRAKYLSKHVESAYPFLADRVPQLDDRIRKMVDTYADIVTQGDVEAAKKDLRSHLREHVVWERNTVWRDLIGIERRAEAATLGSALLGGRVDGSKLRLQGDEAPNMPMKEIETPVGRLTCPTWLFGTTTFTIIGIIAIFIALLKAPIMAREEEQNCLAMLVFVSLLWATEVCVFTCLYRTCMSLTSTSGHPTLCHLLVDSLLVCVTQRGASGRPSPQAAQLERSHGLRLCCDVDTSHYAPAWWFLSRRGTVKVHHRQAHRHLCSEQGRHPPQHCHHRQHVCRCIRQYAGQQRRRTRAVLLNHRGKSRL